MRRNSLKTSTRVTEKREQKARVGVPRKELILLLRWLIIAVYMLAARIAPMSNGLGQLNARALAAMRAHLGQNFQALGGVVLASLGITAWALALRRRALLQCTVLLTEVEELRANGKKQQGERDQLTSEWKHLEGECQRLQAALSVALRREDHRSLEVQRAGQFLHDEREALEAAQEVASAREEAHDSKKQAHETSLEGSRARVAELQRVNAEKTKALDELRAQLDTLRCANKSSRGGVEAAAVDEVRQRVRQPAREPALAQAPVPSPSVVSPSSSVTPPNDASERRAKAALDSAKRRARVHERINERRALAAKMDQKLAEAAEATA